jgi:hypothetical protein
MLVTYGLPGKPFDVHLPSFARHRVLIETAHYERLSKRCSPGRRFAKLISSLGKAECLLQLYGAAAAVARRCAEDRRPRGRQRRQGVEAGEDIDNRKHAKLLPRRLPANITGNKDLNIPVLRCSSPSRPSRNRPAFVATRSCVNDGRIRCLISRSDAAHNASVTVR